MRGLRVRNSISNEKRAVVTWPNSRHLVQLGAANDVTSTSTDSRFYVRVNWICNHWPTYKYLLLAKGVTQQPRIRLRNGNILFELPLGVACWGLVSVGVRYESRNVSR